MKNYIEIQNDPCFISQRLKEIDKSYYILYNIDKFRYEVHSSEQIGDSFCFVIRFDALDERTICYARMTRREQRDKLIQELDLQNAKIQELNKGG